MRRAILILGLAALAGRIVGAADWPQYRGLAHNGTSAETMAAWPSQGLTPLWKVPTPNGFSSWVVKNGRAFTLIARDARGLDREVLLALDAETGRELWSVPFGAARYGHEGGMTGAPNNDGGDGPRSTPAADGDRVYVTTSDLILACFEAATGREIWRRDLVRENQGKNISWKNAASPVIEKDLVLVAGGGPGQAMLGINQENGEVVWKTGRDAMTHATPAVGEILGVRQVIFFTQEGLVSLDPATGTELWRHKYPFSVSTAASPVICGNIVYCSAGYGVGAGAVQLTREGGRFSAREIWRTRGGQLANHWSTPVYKDGFLYGMFQFKEYATGPVKCVDVRTGEEKWAQPGFGPGNLILVDHRLVILSDAGDLVLAEASPDRYTELARFQAVTGKCWSTPAFADGRIFVRSTRQGAAFDASQKLTER